MIRMRDICVSFRSERQEKIFGVSRTQVLFNVSLSIPKGSCLGILGESGSGKSTLGRVICGLLKPDSQYGRYVDGGVNLKKESAVMEAAGAEDTAADMNVMPGEMEVSANIKIVFSMGD